jgi:hypothetical protein
VDIFISESIRELMKVARVISYGKEHSMGPRSISSLPREPAQAAFQPTKPRVAKAGTHGNHKHDSRHKTPKAGDLRPRPASFWFAADARSLLRDPFAIVSADRSFGADTVQEAA